MCRPTLGFLHGSQVFDHNQISEIIRGHINLSVTRLIKALAAGRDKL